MFYTIMDIVLNILNIIVLIKTISFASYEIKTNNNKFGGVLTILIEAIVFGLMLYIIWVK